MAKIEEIYKHINFPTYQDKAIASMLYLAAVIERHFEGKLLPYGISVQQFRILRVLHKFYPGGVAIYKLPQFLPNRKSDVSRMMVRMQNLGWVERIQDTKDKRITNASISPAGIELLNQISSNENSLMLDIRSINEEQAEKLNELLQPLVEEFYTGDE